MKIVAELQITNDFDNPLLFAQLLSKIAISLVQIPPDSTFTGRYQQIKHAGALHDIFGGVFIEGNTEGDATKPVTFRLAIVDSDMLEPSLTLNIQSRKAIVI